MGIPCATSLLTCWSAGCSQVGLELASDSTGPLLFYQCNMTGEALYGLGVQGV
jgi:hypothetical protein